MLSVSERLSSIKLKAPFNSAKVACATFVNWRFVSSTQHTHEKYVASCTTSVYVNLSKNSFLTPKFWKAGAKVRTFSEPPKLFRRNFHLLCKILASLDKYQDAKWATPYYIYKGKRKWGWLGRLGRLGKLGELFARRFGGFNKKQYLCAQ